ncbi:MAG: hypothetical protein IJ189_14005 [Clostridia bacterium]|nr:hypothetical protein [Clostridia bacterium]
MSSLIKMLKALLITVLAYLIQVCVMQYFAIGGMTGSMLFATLAILTVSLGKKYTFCASCIIGMLMESMLSNVPGLYIIAYPVIAMICAQFFADMSDRQRERRRMINDIRRSRRGEGKAVRRLLSRLTGRDRDGDLPAHLRIVLCAALMDLILNIVLIAYMYLIGVDLSFTHFTRALGSVLYTAVLTAVVMGPVRYFLGMYPRRKKRRVGGDIV